MHGVILDEMRSFVADRYGYRAWMETLKRSGHKPTYRYELDGVYPDEELGLLASSAAEATSTPPLELLRGFGEAMVPDLMRVYAYLIDAEWTYADFLMQMEPVLQQAMQLHTPGAVQAKLHPTRVAPDLVRVVYDSPLRACAAVEGVILGAAREYGAKIEVTQEQCQLRGASQCVFAVRIGPESPGISARR